MKKLRLAALIVVFVSFTAFSLVVTFEEGYWGFLANARDHAWGLQVLLDLSIAINLLAVHMYFRARRTGAPFWPYLLSLPWLGSIGALAFYIHAEIAEGRQPPVTSPEGAAPDDRP